MSGYEVGQVERGGLFSSWAEVLGRGSDTELRQTPDLAPFTPSIPESQCPRLGVVLPNPRGCLIIKWVSARETIFKVLLMVCTGLRKCPSTDSGETDCTLEIPELNVPLKVIHLKAVNTYLFL